MSYYLASDLVFCVGYKPRTQQPLVMTSQRDQESQSEVQISIVPHRIQPRLKSNEQLQDIKWIFNEDINNESQYWIAWWNLFQQMKAVVVCRGDGSSLSYEPLFFNFSLTLAEALAQTPQTADSCS